MKLVQQRRYRLNPNYAIKVKEEIDKLLKVGFIRPVKKDYMVKSDRGRTKEKRHNSGLCRLSET